jgi:beta-phosphoglucomutase-like phosphatase (HAD superfamily)
MTSDRALDDVIRQAKHLLFAFDGPIRNVDADNLADPTAPTTPHIHDAFAACRESGRSVVVVSTKPKIDVPVYLDAHDLFEPITVIAASIADAINFLEAAPAECLVIAGSVADIEAAQAAGTPSIGYARTSDDAADLVDAGAVAFVFSLAQVVLSIRA